MRILRLSTALLLAALLCGEVHAAAGAGKRKKSAAPVAKVDTPTRTDTLRMVDTLKVADAAVLARADSLGLALERSEGARRSADTALAAGRAREALLGRSLDSARRAASDASVLLGRQKDSLKVLDSLRQSLAPDPSFVLFLPITFDSVRHPKDSVLAASLTRSLQATALQQRQFSFWTPGGAEQGCNRPECWTEIARRKGAGQVLAGALGYSGDTLIYSVSMVSLPSGQPVRQAQVVGYHREADPSGRFSRMAASQLFGVKNPVLEDKHEDSPLWRRVTLLAIFAIFAGTVTAISW